MPDIEDIKSRLFDLPIVIDAWRQDDIYDGVFPKGARDKSVYFSPKESGIDCLKPDHRYLFKLSRKWCPWQFWVEVIAYRLGLLMGVGVPPAHIGLNRTYAQGRDTYGALIEWFFDDRKDMYVEGGQFMVAFIKDYDRQKGLQHNFTDIANNLGSFPRFMKYWAGVFTLDCLTGNTDRHQDNWGLVIENGKLADAQTGRVIFSPAFDNGTAMGYEILEANLEKYRDEERLQAYLTNPRHAHHHMKWSLEKPEPVNFHDFMRKFVERFPDSLNIIMSYLTFTRSQVEEVTDPLVDAISGSEYSLNRKRLDFMRELIFRRKELLERTLGI